MKSVQEPVDIKKQNTNALPIQQGFSFMEFERESPFVKLEKNLIEIGFFSIPKYRNGKKEPKQEKVVKLLTFEEHGIEAKVEILTHRRYGLPTTSDLTKYLAFTKIVSETIRAGHKLDQPIEFTHYELLKQANLTKNKKAYADITEWLLRMKNTEIQLHGELSLDKKDLITSVNVFDKVMIAGQKNESGFKEKYNRVWLSEWTRSNILESSLIPVDFDTYKLLQNDFAKLLTTHLQVWLFASRNSNIFQKNYNQFCNLLGMTQKTHPSKILQQITPAFDELVKYEYVADWSLRNGPGGFKIVIRHGKKFFRDLKQAFYVIKGKPDELYLNLKSSDTEELIQDSSSIDTLTNEGSELLTRVTGHGISRRTAEHLIKTQNQETLKHRLDYAEFAYDRRRDSIKNKAGYILAVINSDDGIPEWFVSKTQPENRSLDSNQETQNFSALTDSKISYLDLSRFKFERYCLENESFDISSLPVFERFKTDFHEFSSNWAAILEDIAKKVSEQVYSDWFSSLRFGGFIPQENIIIVISSAVTAEWISRTYQTQLNEALEGRYSIRFLEPLVSTHDALDEVMSAYECLIFSEIVTKYNLKFEDCSDQDFN